MKKVKVRQEIKRILGVEAQSLKEARGAIGQNFHQAVHVIFRCQGKVIVTGIGKSGHIAQKIASTFTSTGTPAFYLHPAEGMHGNLGMVNKNDVVLAIGKSGESEEIINILPSIRKIGAKRIALTANKNSSLARMANIVLHMPVKKEVCPLNLAPTTSSTLSMVIGDAIAVTLMKMRGFDADDFALFHPGGTLGKQLLLKVSDIMRGGKDNPKVRVTDSVESLLVEISRKWTGAANVVDSKNKLLGIVTDFDIRKAFAEGQRISDLSIKKLMNRKPKSIFQDKMAIEALKMMEMPKKPLTVLPVVDRKKKSVGMVHTHDLISKGLVSSISKKNSRRTR